MRLVHLAQSKTFELQGKKIDMNLNYNNLVYWLIERVVGCEIEELCRTLHGQICIHSWSPGAAKDTSWTTTQTIYEQGQESSDGAGGLRNLKTYATAVNTGNAWFDASAGLLSSRVRGPLL